MSLLVTYPVVLVSNDNQFFKIFLKDSLTSPCAEILLTTTHLHIAQDTVYFLTSLTSETIKFYLNKYSVSYDVVTLTTEAQLILYANLVAYNSFVSAFCDNYINIAVFQMLYNHNLTQQEPTKEEKQSEPQPNNEKSAEQQSEPQSNNEDSIDDFLERLCADVPVNDDIDALINEFMNEDINTDCSDVFMDDVMALFD